MHSLNIIGAGKCGKSLGYLLSKTKFIYIQDVYNLHGDSTQHAIDFIGEGRPCHQMSDLSSADLILISCPDDMIQSVAKELAQNKSLKPHTIVFHTSGLRSSEDLKVLKEKGCYVASVHPMMSFADPQTSILHFGGCYCGIEGDEQALQLLETIFFDMGAHVFQIEGAKKSLYHAAAVLSSNYLVTLAQVGQETLMESGIEEVQAKNIIVSLMYSSMKNIESHTKIKNALTGPIQRGDIHTIETHLQNISKKHIKNLYIQLGIQTLKLTQHGHKMIEKIKKLFEKES